ncbi:alpha/beta hydrolase-fold protein [Lysobacter niastensis]|uniref:Esterase n=1 Tax=Lysobacter niastensis TaxID=380629 RepID=A0ABS0B8F6_9GAMM|nr:alpha/beta hydrolase-fold protein [Lysobacter niastensis]MBF6025300.1 hypothetical protein [Lysobacter niastensis]
MNRARFLFTAPLLTAALFAGTTVHASTPAAATPAAKESPAAYRTEAMTFAATAFAPEGMRATVYLPPDYAQGDQRYPVLYLNDGQDREAVDLAGTLDRLTASGTIRPPIVVAIDMPKDRMGAYGLSDRKAGHAIVAQTKYGPVGTQAQAYSEWVAHTLVPAVDARYRTRTTPDARAILGWSLGALNAFNLGWQYPELFGRAGAFSPSFWLSSDRSDADAAQRTRLAQRMVDGSEPRNGARWFFAVGTAEDKDDRDGDGINDALDDTCDLIEGWRVGQSGGMKGLRQQNYSVDLHYGSRPARADVAFYELKGGEHNQAGWARMLPVFLTWAYAVHAPALNATGRTESWQDMPSRHVAARNVDVWLPPSYGKVPARRYPVLYMHDGQNLFDPSLSYTGIDWDVDGTMTRLIGEGRVREAIVVGIWNTPLRFQEYMPRKPIPGSALPSGVANVPPMPVDDIRSDAYLRFLVEELKPFIDATYATRPGRDDTFVMGSSMGGLISLYAAAEYPEVFGGVGAVSTHWPVGDGLMIGWLDGHLPDPATHRLYYDFGTATLDAAYAPYQARMDAVMREHGYVEGRNWITRRFEGAEHNERAWRDRLEVPLQFLLGTSASK